MIHHSGHALLVALLLLTAGCSWFGLGDEDEQNKPVKLQSFSKEVDIRQLWSTSIGKGAGDKAIRMVPGLAGSHIFAASADGNVVALQSENGRVIWRVRVADFYDQDERDNAFGKDVDIITGGVGVGGDLVAVGTAAGDIVALKQSDGSMAWRTRTSSEVLAPPQVDAELVVGQSIDGKIIALNTADGERLWTYSTTIPSLTLRGTSTPLVNSEFVIAAFANGRFALLDRAQGLVGFEQRTAIAQGRSDLERLIDIDGAMVIVGQSLYVAGFQGMMVAVNLNNAQLLWNREASTVVGLGEGFGNIYIGYDNGRLGAIDAANGRDVWETEALLNRDITTPVTAGSYVVVGDFEGYLHVIAQSDGRFVGRRKVDRKGIYTPAVTDGNRVYVMGNSGRLSSFELR